MSHLLTHDFKLVGELQLFCIEGSSGGTITNPSPLHYLTNWIQISVLVVTKFILMVPKKGKRHVYGRKPVWII